MKNFSHYCRTRLLQTLADLKSRTDGIAAIEFAILAPLMLAIYFSVVDISLGIAKDRSVSHATNVTGDLATQFPTLDESGIEDVMTAGLAVIGFKASDISRLSGKITIELTSLMVDDDDEVQQIGYARLGPALSALDTDAIAEDSRILNQSSGVVVARMRYEYTPLTTHSFVGDVTLQEKFILKPRQSLNIPFGNVITSEFPNCTLATGAIPSGGGEPSVTVSC